MAILLLFASLVLLCDNDEDDVPSPVIESDDMVEQKDGNQDIVIGNEINSNINSSDEETISPLVLSEKSQSPKKGGGDENKFEFSTTARQ